MGNVEKGSFHVNHSFDCDYRFFLCKEVEEMNSSVQVLNQHFPPGVT